jgi:hypothetical protein
LFISSVRGTKIFDVAFCGRCCDSDDNDGEAANNFAVTDCPRICGCCVCPAKLFVGAALTTFVIGAIVVSDGAACADAKMAAVTDLGRRMFVLKFTLFIFIGIPLIIGGLIADDVRFTVIGDTSFTSIDNCSSIAGFFSVFTISSTMIGDCSLDWSAANWAHEQISSLFSIPLEKLILNSIYRTLFWFCFFFFEAE